MGNGSNWERDYDPWPLAGALLVLPTGGGRTYTAAPFSAIYPPELAEYDGA